MDDLHVDAYASLVKAMQLTPASWECETLLTNWRAMLGISDLTHQTLMDRAAMDPEISSLRAGARAAPRAPPDPAALMRPVPHPAAPPQPFRLPLAPASGLVPRPALPHGGALGLMGGGVMPHGRPPLAQGQAFPSAPAQAAPPHRGAGRPPGADARAPAAFSKANGAKRGAAPKSNLLKRAALQAAAKPRAPPPPAAAAAAPEPGARGSPAPADAASPPTTSAAGTPAGGSKSPAPSKLGKGARHSSKSARLRAVEANCPAEFVEHLNDADMQGLVIERYWEREAWCKGVIAHSVRRRDSQVHHIVYDLESRPTWELNVSLSASQAGEKWRIPRPAQFLHRNWAAILPPESSKKGKKRAVAGGAAAGEPVLKQAAREHTDAAIAAVAAEAAGTGDAAPLERVLADIRHAKGVFMEMLAQRRAADGLRRQSKDELLAELTRLLADTKQQRAAVQHELRALPAA